jgi:hypothetical protein
MAHTQWVKTSGGTFGGNVNCFAISDTNLFVGGGGIFLSTDNGTNWVGVDVGLATGDVYAIVVSDTNLFAGTTGRGVLISTNKGITWDNTYNHVLRLYSVSSLALSGTNLFAGTYDHGVFLSTNNGTSWAAKNTNLTDSVVTALVANGTNLLAATTSGIFLSTDNGISWHSTIMTNPHVRSFVASSSDLFAGADDKGVFLSTDNGTNWSAVNSGLKNIYVEALALSGSYLFAGTFGGGVYLSTNNGTSWNEVNIGLDTSAHFVTSLAVIGTNLFAGMYGGAGVWRRPISEMVTAVNETKSEIPRSFSLSQNYPNPFNPATVISFTLPSKSFVSLKVFDIIGKEVATIVSEEMLAGNHSRQWNAAKMSSGIYFYRMHAGFFTETKKLVLIR